jgi:hypothetical protein
MGKLENTLIIYISGDNGSSAEGTPSEVLAFNGRAVDRQGIVERLQRLLQFTQIRYVRLMLLSVMASMMRLFSARHTGSACR